MRNRYITAVLSLLTTGHDVDLVIHGLRKTLADRDHGRLFPSILKGVVRTLEDGAKTSVARVTVAKPADATELASLITKLLAQVGAAEHQIATDNTIIGGAVVEFGHERVDASYKRALTELYERTIA